MEAKALGPRFRGDERMSGTERSEALAADAGFYGMPPRWARPPSMVTMVPLT
jgi:hypothetical protein